MSKDSRTLLTITKINAMKIGEELWDTDVPGLHVRAGARGKSFRLGYTDLNGDPRRHTFGIISLQQARENAKKWRDMISAGIDPQQEQGKKLPRSSCVTLKDLKIRWEVEAKRSEETWALIQASGGRYERVDSGRNRVAFSFMKPITIQAYRKNWKEILAFMGPEKTLTSICLADLEDLHRHLSVKRPCAANCATQGGPRIANYAIDFLNTLLQRAVVWGLLEESEAPRFDIMFKRLPRNPKKRKKLFISEEQFPQLGVALQKLKSAEIDGKKKDKKRLREDLCIADLAEVLLASGTRLREFMTARLSWVDWSGKVKYMRLPDTKGGARDVELGGDMLTFLKRRTDEWVAAGRNPDDDFVIRSPRKVGAPLRHPKKGWKNFMILAGLDPKITPHAVRHTVITMGVAKAGLSLKQAGGIVGHSSEAITGNYAHKVGGAVVDSINKTTAAIAEMMAGKIVHDENEVVPDFIKEQRKMTAQLHEAPAGQAH